MVNRVRLDSSALISTANNFASGVMTVPASMAAKGDSNVRFNLGSCPG